MPRPRQFDEDAVLTAAAECFWGRGFEATSTRDLAGAMALTPASLYNAFGDKRALFLRALDHYLQRTLHDRVRRLEAVDHPGLGITLFLAEIVDRSSGDARQRGCMLVNTALEAGPDDPSIQAVVADEIGVIEDFFRGRMALGRAGGAIPPGPPVDQAAALLLSVLLGVRVLARLGPGRARLAAPVHAVLALLGLPPLPEGSVAA